MVEIKVDYLGDLRCKATHGPSGQSLLTDAPTDNNGKGEYFSPTDLVATGLATCMLTIMGYQAKKNNIDMTGATATVIKEMTKAPPRKIETLTVSVTVPAKLTPEQKKILEDAAMHCPVHKTIGEVVQLPIKFNWG